MVKWSKTAKILNYNFHVWKKEKKLVSCLWAIFMQKVFSSFTSSPPWSFQKLILVLLGVLQINFRLWKVLHLLDLYFFPRVAAAGERKSIKNSYTSIHQKLCISLMNSATTKKETPLHTKLDILKHSKPQSLINSNRW